VATLTPDMVEKLGLGLMWVPTMTLAMVALTSCARSRSRSRFTARSLPNVVTGHGGRAVVRPKRKVLQSLTLLKDAMQLGKGAVQAAVRGSRRWDTCLSAFSPSPYCVSRRRVSSLRDVVVTCTATPPDAASWR
jgi:hypothetical protein